MGVRDTLRQRLHGALAYEVEAVRMSKRLAAPESEQLRLAVDQALAQGDV